MPIIIVAIWFVLNIFQFFSTGYIFNKSRPEDFNSFISIVQTIGLFVLFVTANWSICTLLEGKGRLSEIMAVFSYSLVPYLASIIVITILSNVLSLEDGNFLSLISTIGLIWSVFIMFVGFMNIHEYTLKKTLLSMILTFLGMGVIIFLIILFYSLMSQAGEFVKSIMQEISLRS